jgi:hypothetical protein
MTPKGKTAQEGLRAVRVSNKLTVSGAPAVGVNSRRIRKRAEYRPGVVGHVHSVYTLTDGHSDTRPDFPGTQRGVLFKGGGAP